MKKLDKEGQIYIYEYRISKYTGAITKREKIDIFKIKDGL